MLAIKSKKRFEYCSGLTVDISAPAYSENWEKKEGRTSVLFDAFVIEDVNKFHVQYQNQSLETQIVMTFK